MATNKGISEDKFNNIKVIVSRWYDSYHFVSMLKVVYKEHLGNNVLGNAETTINILNSLYAAGDLSSTDLTLLYETIKLTNQLGLEKKIKAILPSLPNIRETVISRFSDHRQRIVEFGHALIDAHIHAIDGICNNPKKNYGDGWLMISDLEHRLIICKGKRMDTFIKKIKTLELDNLIRILKDSKPSRRRKAQQTLEDVQEQPKQKKESRTSKKKSSKIDITPNRKQKSQQTLVNVQEQLKQKKKSRTPKKKSSRIDITPNRKQKTQQTLVNVQEQPKQKKKSRTPKKKSSEIEITPNRKRKAEQTLDVQEQPKQKKKSRTPKKKSSRIVISEEDYPILLDRVSTWWRDRGNINMLKLLLRQFKPKISQLDLQKTNDVMDLFTLLEAKGELTKSKLNILFEAVKICGLEGVENDIQDILPTFQGFKKVDIKIFSTYRQKLIKFGSSLDIDSIKRIGQVTGINKKENQKDQWLLICALEDKGTIKEDSLTEFISLLRRIKMKQIADILE